MSDLLFAARSLGLQFELFAGALCFVWVAWLVVWILVAVWVYKDAESRGASGALWAVIVIFLGLIGLIIYLVVRPSGPRPVYPGYPGYAGQPPPQYAYQYPQQPGQPPAQQPPQQAPVQAPGQAAQTATPNCPRCGRPLTYVYQYQRWFCPAENVYPWG